MVDKRVDFLGSLVLIGFKSDIIGVYAWQLLTNRPVDY